jgi:hypothetical protein
VTIVVALAVVRRREVLRVADLTRGAGGRARAEGGVSEVHARVDDGDALVGAAPVLGEGGGLADEREAACERGASDVVLEHRRDIRVREELRELGAAGLAYDEHREAREVLHAR